MKNEVIMLIVFAIVFIVPLTIMTIIHLKDFINEYYHKDIHEKIDS